ncbi:MAG: VWA domain-containing protein [Bryobacteraceae bacterium]|jgi:VWFA-related protein
MRLPKAFVMCTAILAGSLASLTLAQEQGPLKDPGQTIAKPKQPPADSSTTSGADNGANTDLPKIPSQYKKSPNTTGLANFKTDVDLVTLDVSVVDTKGHFLPGIPPTRFRVLEDNVPQQIRQVTLGEAPLTIAMLIEFSNKFQRLYGPTWFQTLNLAWGFASTLKPQDFVAVIAYDMKPEILSDFSTDRNQTHEALQRLSIPAWQEANLFDALTDTADRMSGIEGRKAILLISSGIDTFSKLTFDKTRKIVQEAGVPIYAVGLMQMLREMTDARGRMGPIQDMDFLQADNEMRTFAKESGGMAFFPRFQGENSEIFQQVQQSLRNQYVISYSSNNKVHDGSYRKIKVELIDDNGNPMAFKDDKGKPVKYAVLTKSGYKAPREVE